VGVTRTDYYGDPDAPRANSIFLAVTAFVLDDAGRLLVIRRSDNGRHAIPGGRHELGESMSEAAIREVVEETGISVEITGLVGIYSDPAHVIAYRDGKVRQEFSICFRGRPVSGEPRTSDESTEVRWVDRSDLDQLDIDRHILLRIDHGYANRAEPYYT
jgi:ADP-ribose pyrophosphatase YjhB (NUDIX family)